MGKECLIFLGPKLSYFGLCHRTVMRFVSIPGKNISDNCTGDWCNGLMNHKTVDKILYSQR